MAEDGIAVSHALREAERRLAAAGLPSPGADARLLLAHALAIEPNRLLTREAISTVSHRAYADLVAERAEGVPLQHLTGQATFRRCTLRVGPGAFVPRPETEAMTGWVLDRIAELAGQPHLRVVDLCTGSGAIARALWDETRPLHDRLELHALELSDDAIGYAASNLAGTGATLHHADLAEAPALLGPQLDPRPFDIVVANPPYIPLQAFESVAPEVRDHEPALALFSGDDGLDAIRVLARVAAVLLRPGGWLACEHAEVQSGTVRELLAHTGNFTQIRDHDDLTGRPRFVTARRANRPSAAPDLAGWTA